ncbi:MAG: putative toxin-antitoxin system toxin component, PIN family [Nanoarchaeota archaeon]|nr:putative toxin-antitoxin system toxin component, PIN family [Nanoarchaeota archaeon]
MLKVVIDTNVIISAALSNDGNPSKVFEMFLSGKIENYTSEEINLEVKEVMERRKIRELLDFQDRKFIFDNFEGNSNKVIPSEKYFEIKDDPKDNKFLDCAALAGVDYIISGDEHLLKLKKFKEIIIISPADFVIKYYHIL